MKAFLSAFALLILTIPAQAAKDSAKLRQTLNYCERARERDPSCMQDLIAELSSELGADEGENFWRSCMNESNYDPGQCVSSLVDKLRTLNSFSAPQVVCTYDGQEVNSFGMYTSDKYIQVNAFESGLVTLSVSTRLSDSERRAEEQKYNVGVLSGPELGRDSAQIDLNSGSSQSIYLSAAGIGLTGWLLRFR